jgi:hypothetical protein
MHEKVVAPLLSTKTVLAFVIPILRDGAQCPRRDDDTDRQKFAHDGSS